MEIKFIRSSNILKYQVLYVKKMQVTTAIFLTDVTKNRLVHTSGYWVCHNAHALNWCEMLKYEKFSIQAFHLRKY